MTETPVTPSPGTPINDGTAQCRALQATLNGLLEKLLGEPDTDGVKQAAQDLGIYADDAINIGDDVETEALLDYYLCGAELEGGTRLQAFLAAPPATLDEDELRLLQALTESTYSVFEHKAGSGDGILYRDMLGESSFEDPYGVLDTKPGDAFAARIVRDGELWCHTHELLTLEPSIKRFFTIPRAVRDLALTLPDGDDLDLESHGPRFVLRAVLAGRAVKDYMDETGRRVAPKRPPRSLKRPSKRRRK